MMIKKILKEKALIRNKIQNNLHLKTEIKNKQRKMFN